MILKDTRPYDPDLIITEESIEDGIDTYTGPEARNKHELTDWIPVLNITGAPSIHSINNLIENAHRYITAGI